jgi:ribosomal protein L15
MDAARDREIEVLERLGRGRRRDARPSVDAAPGDRLERGVQLQHYVIDRSIKRVKIMLSGDVTKKVTVEGVGVTKGAKAAIEAAGGKVVEMVAVEKPPSKKKKNTGKQTAAARKKIADAAGKASK